MPPPRPLLIFRRPLPRQGALPKSQLKPQIRPQSSQSAQTTSTTRTRQRVQRLQSKLPKFLHPYTTPLLSAPISHLISFLILHEITAIVPLIGLACTFHYTNWLPETWVEGRWVKEGIERWGSYFGGKGWFGFERKDKVTQIMDRDGEGQGNGRVAGTDNGLGRVDGKMEVITQGGKEDKRWWVGEQGSRILVEVATAYAITKVFLPARILLSVWGTPWFARVFVGRFMGMFKGRVKVNAGTVGVGASAGGVGGGVGIGKVVESGKKVPP